MEGGGPVRAGAAPVRPSMDAVERESQSGFYRTEGRMVDIETYRSARDFFEAARCAAAEVARAERQLERMSAAEGVRAQGYGPRGKGSRRDVNGTAATDARIDYEARMRRRIEEDRALIGEARAVAYGPDGSGGIAKLLDSATADAVWWRYCAGESWARTADMVGCDRKTAKARCVVAFDTVDAVGWDAAKRGEGGAEG